MSMARGQDSSAARSFKTPRRHPLTIRGIRRTIMSRNQFFVRGLRDSVPMLVGIAPFGIIFGTLAGVGGLTLWQAVGMSMFVYAGSAQFIVVSLMGAGAGA